VNSEALRVIPSWDQGLICGGGSHSPVEKRSCPIPDRIRRTRSADRRPMLTTCRFLVFLAFFLATSGLAASAALAIHATSADDGGWLVAWAGLAAAHAIGGGLICLIVVRRIAPAVRALSPRGGSSGSSVRRRFGLPRITNEFGQIERTSNERVQQAEASLAAIIELAGPLTAQSTAVAYGAGGFAQQVEAQAQAAAEIDRAMADLLEHIEQVASQTKDAASQAESAISTADDGGRSMHATIDTVRRLGSVVRDSGGQVERLQDRCGEIAGAARSISDIAEQTNLLALNASIEAARAGDAGRGFAVVAQEVGKLAERSAQAASEIGRLVDAIAEGTAAVVSSTQAGAEEADAGAERASAAHHGLEQITAAIRDLNEGVGSILASAEAQRASAERVNSGIAHIERSVQSARDECEFLRSNTEQLAAASDEFGAALADVH